MIGDQLDRDIAYARDAGFRTILFPGTFSPYWLDNTEAEPDYVIHDYADVPHILDQIQRIELDA